MGARPGIRRGANLAAAPFVLIRLGTRARKESDVVDRLLECHERIRNFCALACRLAEGPPSEQAREAAAQLVRYFTVALPLHVADEEESIRPRLTTVAADVD